MRGYKTSVPFRPAGFAPPVGGVEAAVSPVAAALISETFTMKAKVVLAVLGVALVAGGFPADNRLTPTAEAAPVPRELRPLPKDAWGPAKGDLQAGLRMPDGVTLDIGQGKELQVVVRNVGKMAREVWYTPQQHGVSLCGGTHHGKFQLGTCINWNGRPPTPVNTVLEPGEVLVRWRGVVRHGPGGDAAETTPDDPTAPRLHLTTGTHTLVMRHLGGDLVDEFKPRDGAIAMNFFAHNPLAIGTGELTVRCLPPNPAPRRNAPVPKDPRRP